jgi:predicted amidohydrolase
MAEKTRVGIVGISMQPVSVEQRRKDIVAAIDDAAGRDCALVCFPEYLPVQRTKEAVAEVDAGQGDDIYARTAESVPDGPTSQALAAACRGGGIWAIYGLCERWREGRVTNTVVVTDDRGQVVARHHKTHCAPGEDEEGGVSSGDALEPLDTPFGRIGVMTCYEVYFPEVARVYEAKGADWLYYPHADNSVHCLRVAQARAFDSHTPLIMCGYIDPNSGSDDGPVGVAAVDARGQVIAHERCSTGVLVVDVDLKQRVQSSQRWNRPEDTVDQREFRWNRRRPQLYGSLGV